MDYRIISAEEFAELERKANKERAAKSAASRRVRLWLERLYDLEDPRAI